MAVTFKQITDFLIESGADAVAHTQKGYLPHAIGVYKDLKKWGFDEEFSRAGLFHSIYGTQMFQGFTWPLDRRSDIRELVGSRVENLCYLNCVMLREPFYEQSSEDQGTYSIENRISGEIIEIDRAVYDDLCHLHLCDWLEQVARSDSWGFQRDEFRNLAKRLGGIAEETYDRVFAREPTGQTDGANR